MQTISPAGASEGAPWNRNRLSFQPSAGSSRSGPGSRPRTRGGGRLHPWAAAALLAGAFALASCVGDVTDPAIGSVTGEWCTLEGLDSTNLPGPSVAFIGMVLFQDAGEISGTGSVSRPGDPEIVPSRYRGDLVGGTLTLDRTDLETDRTEPGPVFTLTLRLDGRDLIGSAVGDPEFSGPVHLVRLGPRCFAD